jgi:hypothetical protein
MVVINFRSSECKSNHTVNYSVVGMVVGCSLSILDLQSARVLILLITMLWGWSWDARYRF